MTTTTITLIITVTFAVNVYVLLHPYGRTDRP